MGAHILRRRDRDEKSPFGIASRTFEAIRGRVEDAGKKVTLDNLSSQMASLAGREKKDKEKIVSRVAPLGVTHAYSLVLTHVIAPLWSVGTKPCGVYPPLTLRQERFVDLAKALDTRGHTLEYHLERLAANQQVVTVYIILLLARLVCIEGSDTGSPTFEELLYQTAAYTPKLEYEEHANDETVAHDQPRRRLTEVGGTWRAKGAAEVPHRIHQLRHRLLCDVMKASVCFKYFFNEEHVQFLADTLCTKMFLVGYSETLVQLVAGIKGSMYVGKYMVLQCAPSFPKFTSSHPAATAAESVQPDPALASALLTEVKQLAGLALSNFIHRNDTGDIVIAAMIKSTPNCPLPSIPALFTRFVGYLRTVYVVDVQALATLLDCVRKYALHKEPIGPTSYALMHEVSKAMRFPGSTQRALASSLVVGGVDMRSFRLQPAHVITNPYAARSAALIQALLMEPIGLQRVYGGGAPFAERGVPVEQISGCGMLPVAFPPQGKFVDSRRDPAAGAAVGSQEQFIACGQSFHFVDDTALYIANLCINIFQAAVELLGESDPKMGSIDLGLLFSIPPHVLCRYYPQLFQLVTSHQRMLQDAIHQSPDTSAVGSAAAPLTASLNTLFTAPEAPQLINALHSCYLTICDQCTAERGQKRFRLESPHIPSVPLLLNVCTEQDDMNEYLKELMERHWRYCDSRVVAAERDPVNGAAFLHPARDMSLSHFIENEVKLVVAGGDGTLRAVVSSIMQLQNLYPGTLLKPKVYILPFGFDNDLASWLARSDPIYYEDIHCNFLLDPVLNVDAPLVEQLKMAGTMDALTAGNPCAVPAPAPSPPTPSGKRAAPPVVEERSPLAVFPPLRALLLRGYLNRYLMHATCENRVIVYQAECVSAIDGKLSVVPFMCNFEIGAHITQALKQLGLLSGTLHERFGGGLNAASPQAATGSDAPAQFAAEASTNSFIGTVAKSFTSNKVPNVSGMVGSAGLGTTSTGVPVRLAGDSSTVHCTSGAKGNLASPTVAFGTTTETLDKILARLHGVKGPKLGIRRHIGDPRKGDIRHACSGVELLDWISTTYHVYEASIAVRAVQSLIDYGVFVCASAPHDQDMSRFCEAAIYTIREREEVDAQPRLIPSSRGAFLQLAAKYHHDAVGAISVREGFSRGAAQPFLEEVEGDGGAGHDPVGHVLGGELPSLCVRVSFKGGTSGDLRYSDIDEDMVQTEVLKRAGGKGDGEDESSAVAASVHTALVRDIVSLKIRSTGGGGDHGPVADPTSPLLQMSILQGERKKRWGGAWSAGSTASNSASRAGREPSGLFENYSLNFAPEGSGGVLARPGACLTIDHEGFKPGADLKDRSGALDGYGLMCSADGDVFGPFSTIRIKPITLSAGPATTPRGQSNAPRTCSTISVMSFMKPVNAPTSL